MREMNIVTINLAHPDALDATLRIPAKRMRRLLAWLAFFLGHYDVAMAIKLHFAPILADFFRQCALARWGISVPDPTRPHRWTTFPCEPEHAILPLLMMKGSTRIPWFLAPALLDNLLCAEKTWRCRRPGQYLPLWQMLDLDRPLCRWYDAKEVSVSLNPMPATEEEWEHLLDLVKHAHIKQLDLIVRNVQ